MHLMGTTSGQFDIFLWYRLGYAHRPVCWRNHHGHDGVDRRPHRALSAYYTGWLDDVLMRITEIFMAFPFCCRTNAFRYSGAALWTGHLAGGHRMVTFGWMTCAPDPRRNFFSQRTRLRSGCAVVGVRDFRIILRHIMPNAIYPILIMASCGWAITFSLLPTLSFSGCGYRDRLCRLGQIVSFSRDWILSLESTGTSSSTPRGAAALRLGLELIGDALRDSWTPDAPQPVTRKTKFQSNARCREPMQKRCCKRNTFLQQAYLIFT